MTTETTVSADANSENAASGEVDAQLATMQAAEEGGTGQAGAEDPAKTAVKEERVVPLAALHEERNQRKQLQRQIEENARQQAARDAIIERRLAALAPQQRVPDKNDTPVDYLDHRLNEVSQAQRQIIEQNQQREQQQTQERQYQAVASRVVEHAAAFGKQTPDFLDAVEHLNGTRTRELMALGVSPDEAATQARLELDQAAVQWTLQGRNPAQTAYEFAKARGFTGKPQQTPEQKIAAQQRGTAAAKSLGGGGAVTGGKLTAQALADMSDEDFAKLTDSQFRQAMGG